MVVNTTDVLAGVVVLGVVATEVIPDNNNITPNTMIYSRGNNIKKSSLILSLI